MTNNGKIYQGSKGSQSIYIHFQEYKDFDFSVTGISFSAIDRVKFVKNVKIGDTISVVIKKDDYIMKLTNEKELGFFDKTVNYSFIDVYGVRDKRYEYLTLKKYNEAQLKDAPWIIISILFFGLIGLYIIGTAIYLINKKRY